MAKYRIGQLSTLLGIPATTIRYLEQAQVLVTKHDPNGYRYYDEVDIHNIMHYQFYRSLDYPQVEATYNLYEYTIDQIIEGGSTMLDQLEHDLWFDQRRVEIQLDRLRFFKYAKDHIQQIDTMVRPSLFVLPYRKRQMDQTITLFDEPTRESMIRKWMHAMPLVSLTPLIQPQDFIHHHRIEYSALMVDQNDAEKVGLSTNAYVQSLPQCLCLRFIIYRQQGYMNAFVDYSSEVYRYMENHGLTINGVITFSNYVAFHKHTTHEFYGEMLIPYTKL